MSLPAYAVFKDKERRGNMLVLWDNRTFRYILSGGLFAMSVVGVYFHSVPSYLVVQFIGWIILGLNILRDKRGWNKRYSWFKEPCPNCESAWSGGALYPEEITFCIACSDPKTGEIRGWVWRWGWFHRKFVSSKNWAKL